MSFRHRQAMKTPKDTSNLDFEEPFDEKKRLLPNKNEYDEDYDKQRKEIDSIYSQYGDTQKDMFTFLEESKRKKQTVRIASTMPNLSLNSDQSDRGYEGDNSSYKDSFATQPDKKPLLNVPVTQTRCLGTCWTGFIRVFRR